MDYISNLCLVSWANKRLYWQSKIRRKINDTRIFSGVSDYPCFLTFFSYDAYQLKNCKIFLILEILL